MNTLRLQTSLSSHQQQTSFKGGDGRHVVMSASCLPPVVPSDCSTQIATALSSAGAFTHNNIYAAVRPCSHRVDYCIHLIRLSACSLLLRRHEDVTLRKREQAREDPGDFLTPADRSSVRWLRESVVSSADVTNGIKTVVMWRTIDV